MCLYVDILSPVGNLTVVSDSGGSAVKAVWICGQRFHGKQFFGSEELVEKSCPLLQETAYWLEQYFAGKRPDPCDLPLDPDGSDFRKEVWSILRGIPYGEVITYGDIAGEIAKRHGKNKMSAQAVGGAVGHNPISIIIPCHRVIGANGNLTGYGGGIRTKIFLLELERVNISRMYVPAHGTALQGGSL